MRKGDRWNVARTLSLALAASGVGKRFQSPVARADSAADIVLIGEESDTRHNGIVFWVTTSHAPKAFYPPRPTTAQC